jgi:SEC-C motif-containing protein
MTKEIGTNEMTNCLCGSDKSFGECCEPFLNGMGNAPTAEALMRARYSAYATANIDFIERTIYSSNRAEFDRESALKWAERSQWHGLEILNVIDGKEDDAEGSVEFIATYSQQDESVKHHEVATFRKEAGTWTFVDGHIAATNQKSAGTIPAIAAVVRNIKSAAGRSKPRSSGSLPEN